MTITVYRIRAAGAVGRGSVAAAGALARGERARMGSASTGDLRNAMLQYRALFEELVAPSGRDGEPETGRDIHAFARQNSRPNHLGGCGVIRHGIA